MKTARLLGVGLACAFGLGLSQPASAQRRLSIAIMPSQYFSATAATAENFTQGLAQAFEGRGYTVTGADRTQSTFQSLGLSPSTHYADSVALRYGRSIGADLVAYPRVLAVGIPAAGAPGAGSLLEPAAVVHLRVLNVRSGGPIYFRQIGHEFSAPAPDDINNFQLPQPVAAAAATEVLDVYFRTVAGSARETRGGR